MSSRRWVILAVAVLLGLVAGGLVYNYVQGVEDDLDEENARVEVYKLTANVPKGTFAEDAFENGWIEKGEIAAEFRPATAITDPDQIAGQVAIADLAANQVVVTDQFASQATQLSTFSELLQQNQVAVTISVDQVRGVAGLLVPGDFVNMIIADPDYEEIDAAPSDGAAPASQATVDCISPDGAIVAPPAGQSLVCPQARYLYQKVQILAIGTQRELQPGETVDTNPDGSPVVQSTGLLTLAVPADAAQWITSFTEVYLTLVAKDYSPIPVGPIAPSPTFPAENPQTLTPYGPEGQTTP